MKKIPIYFNKIELFFSFGIKISLSTSLFTFTTISPILKKNVIYLGHKHVKTGPNCLHELATYYYNIEF